MLLLKAPIEATRTRYCMVMEWGPWKDDLPLALKLTTPKEVRGVQVKTKKTGRPNSRCLGTPSFPIELAGVWRLESLFLTLIDKEGRSSQY